MTEIVEIVLGELNGDRWAWTALHGQPQRGSDVIALCGLSPGDRLVVEVAPDRTAWAIQRLVRWPQNAIATAAVRTESDSSHSANSGDVFGTGPDRSGGIEPGDVVLRRVRFTAASGESRNSKMRPCVVMEVHPNELRVRPIHGSNSFVRREGLGRRLNDWAAAGLNKPSVVAATDLWVSANGPGPIGRLTQTDRVRILSQRD